MKYLKVIIYYFFIFTFSCIFGYSTNIKKLPSINNARKLDKKIWELSKPATLNYVMVPIVGMVDTLWVTKLGSSKDLAGVGCGDQIFSIFFCIISFLPVILTPEIARLHTEEKKNEIANLISVSLCLSVISGMLVSVLLFLNIDLITSIFSSKSNEVFSRTVLYLKYRTPALSFCIINSVIFSVFRGLMDFKQALAINIVSQVINVILDPIFMIKYGISGVASASLISDIVCTIGYIKLLIKNKLITYKVTNFFKISKNYLNLGLFIQMKYILINIIYLLINKRLLQLDNTGTELAAYIILSKFISLTMITYSGLSSVASIVIPSEKIYNNDHLARKQILFYGHIVCLLQSLLFFNLKYFLKYLSNDVNVICLAKKLIIPATIYQYINGYQYVMEGILQGYQKFKLSSKLNILTNLPLLFILWKIDRQDYFWYIGSLLYYIKILFIKKNLKV